MALLRGEASNVAPSPRRITPNLDTGQHEYTFATPEEAANFAAQNPGEIADVVINNADGNIVRMRGRSILGPVFGWADLSRVPDGAGHGGGEIASVLHEQPWMRPTRDDTIHGLGVFGAGAAGGALAENDRRRDERQLRRQLQRLMRQEYRA